MFGFEWLNREVIYFIGSGVAAFFMAIFRTVRFSDRERQQWFMRLNEGFMCAMISSGIAVMARSYFDTPYSWAIPIGVIVGFIGTNFIHALIKSLIEFQVGRYTGGQVSMKDVEQLKDRVPRQQVDNPDEVDSKKSK